MTNKVQFILSLCIGLTVIIGVVKYKTIDRSYYPFFYLAGISLLVEIVSYILSANGIKSAIPVVINVFCFAEFFFYTWLFHVWGLFNFRYKVFFAVIAFFFAGWVILTFFAGTITQPNFYFRVIYSMTLLFFAVTCFNKFVIPHRAAIFKNPKFWILTGMIIFFSFYLLIQSANLSIFGMNTSKGFRRGLYDIVSYSNLIVNLMFAIGALCIPRKKNFTTLF
jgi:hypothetical protein